MSLAQGVLHNLRNLRNLACRLCSWPNVGGRLVWLDIRFSSEAFCKVLLANIGSYWFFIGVCCSLVLFLLMYWFFFYAGRRFIAARRSGGWQATEICQAGVGVGRRRLICKIFGDQKLKTVSMLGAINAICLRWGAKKKTLGHRKGAHRFGKCAGVPPHFR